MIPGPVPQNITVIAFNDIIRPHRDSFEIAAQTIPFFGYLLGMAYVGHAVTIFEGSASALALGCRDADVIIHDEEMMPLLPDGWQELISQTTRHSRILIFGQGGKLSVLVRTS